MAFPTRILVADDEPNIRLVLRESLRREGHEVLEAADGQEAIDAASRERFALAILDVKMPRVDGLVALEKIRQLDPDLPVVMITAHGGRPIALEAVRLGAYDYFEKPFEMQELRVVVKRALERRSLRWQIAALEEQLRSERSFDNIIGDGPAMREALSLVRRVMATEATVLVTGESGTGKELIAEALHFNSPRAARPLLKINCAAIPEALLESELFGHEKGAFTGAVAMKLGKFEVADKGTVFLDEIGEMPPSLQPKILRAIQQKEIERVGSSQTIPVDVRVIAASNRDLAREVEAGRFRADLFFRLNVVPIHLPPLRERREDIPALVEHFVRKFDADLRKSVRGFAPEAMERMQAYAWPGNVREMENIVQRAIILGSGSTLGVEALPPEIQRAGMPAETGATPATLGALELGFDWEDFAIPLSAKIERLTETFEAQLIRAALKKMGGRRQETADLLGISRKSLHNKMLRYKLFQEETRESIRERT